MRLDYIVVSYYLKLLLNCNYNVRLITLKYKILCFEHSH